MFLFTYRFDRPNWWDLSCTSILLFSEIAIAPATKTNTIKNRTTRARTFGRAIWCFVLNNDSPLMITLPRTSHRTIGIIAKSVKLHFQPISRARD